MDRRKTSDRFYYIVMRGNELHEHRASFPEDCISKYYSDVSECLNHVEGLATIISNRLAGSTIETESPSSGALLRLTVKDKSDWLITCEVMCEDLRGKTIH